MQSHPSATDSDAVPYSHNETRARLHLPDNRVYRTMQKLQRVELARTELAPDRQIVLLLKVQFVKSSHGYRCDASGYYEFVRRNGTQFAPTILVPETREYTTKGLMTDVRPRLESYVELLFRCLAMDVESCRVHRLADLPLPSRTQPASSKPKPPPRPTPACLTYQPPKIKKIIRPSREQAQPAPQPSPRKEPELSRHNRSNKENREENRTFKRLTQKQTVNLGIALQRDSAMLNSREYTNEDFVKKYSEELQCPHLNWGMIRSLLRSLEIPFRIKNTVKPDSKTSTRARIPFRAACRVIVHICKELQVQSADLDALNDYLEGSVTESDSDT